MAIVMQSLLANGAEHPPVRPWVAGDSGGVVLSRWPAPGEPMPDFFAVLGVPAKLGLDEAAVELQVRSLIRGLHPDRFHRDGPEAVAMAQRHTALVNDAWRVLRDLERRCQYAVELAGDRPDEAFAPSGAELAATFERNEQLDECEQAPRQHRKELLSLLGELEGERVDRVEELRAAAAQWDGAALPHEQHQARKALRAALGRLAYLDRLRGRLKALLERAAQAG